MRLRTLNVPMRGTLTAAVLLAPFVMLSSAGCSDEDTAPRASVTEADGVAHLTVAGMECARCAASVERLLREQPGVVAAEVDVVSGRAVVRYARRHATPGGLAAAISEAGVFRAEACTGPLCSDRDAAH